jgi:hypothetical protein
MEFNVLMLYNTPHFPQRKALKAMVTAEVSEDFDIVDIVRK